MSESSSTGTIAAVTVAIIWGLSFVAARLALTTLTPLLLATLRFGIASLVFLPVIIEDLRHGATRTTRSLAELALLGLLSITMYFWLQYTGVKYAGAGVSALLVVGLIPILTGIASASLLKEKFGVRRVFGTVLGLTGIALITLPKLFLGEVDMLFYLGVLSLLADAILFALYSTLSRRLMTRARKPLVVTAYTTVMGTLALIPISLAENWSLTSSLQAGQWVSVLYLALVCSCAGYALWNFALSRLDAVKAAVWLYLEPVAAFVGEALLWGIVPTPTTLVGGGAVILGSLLTSRARR